MKTIMKLNAILHTNGKGFWTDEVREVKFPKMELKLMEDGEWHDDFGELRVYFTKQSWDIDKHGLIYTDPLFEKELRTHLRAMGARGVSDISGSEQGMQGDDYVSFDVGKGFIKWWREVNK